MNCKDCKNYVEDNWQYLNRLSELYKELGLIDQDLRDNPNNEYLKEQITEQRQIIDDFKEKRGYAGRNEASFCNQLDCDTQYYDDWENDFYIDCDLADFSN